MFGANHAPILHQHWLPTDQYEIPHDPRHLGVPSGASKTIFDPTECLAQTLHLSCVKISTTSKRTETSFCLSLITYEYHWVRQNDFRAYGMFGANRAPVLHRHWLPTDRNEIPLDPRHLGVPSGASKMILEAMVCLAQTMHLSCTDTGSQ